MSDTLTPQIQHQLIDLFMEGQQMNAPMYELLLIREQLESRPLVQADREAILTELGTLLQVLQELSGKLYTLHTLLQ